MRVTLWPAAALMAALCACAHADTLTDFAALPGAADTFASAAAHRRADALVHRMTLDEKLQFIHSKYEMSQVPGGGAGYIQGVPRLGIPDLNMVDSATGSGSTSQASTTFPATIAVAASWDRGLSYTHFSYSGLAVSRQRDGSLDVAFTVRNDGPVAGAEVPQVYLGVPYKDEPPRRLVGWDRIDLKPGEARRVHIGVSARMQSVWDTSRNGWRYVPGGTVSVGASSRDIRLQGG